MKYNHGKKKTLQLEIALKNVWKIINYFEHDYRLISILLYYIIKDTIKFV
jgi:hypothetical protein